MDARDVLYALEIEGSLVPALCFDGRQFMAAVSLDVAEVERRRRAGLGAILSRRVLQALMSLPVGLPVDRKEIDPLVQAFLDDLPLGIVDSRPTDLIRRWRPALRVRMILVRSRAWRQGLESASLFVADGPRTLVLDIQPTSSEARQLAAKLGVGLVVLSSSGDPTVIAEPDQAWSGRSSARHWEFLETVYDGWLTIEGIDVHAFR